MLTLVAIFVLFPVYYMITLSLRSQSSLFTKSTLLPVDSNLDNYRAAFENTDFKRSLLNSVIVCGTATVIAVLFSVMAAYALTILKFRGRDT
jgi:ABC-type glycerol-3-phosphate transport system permease component